MKKTINGCQQEMTKELELNDREFCKNHYKNVSVSNHKHTETKKNQKTSANGPNGNFGAELKNTIVKI